MRQFRRSFSLSFATNEASAIWLAAIAWLWVCTISVDIIVKNKFFASFYGPLGKYSHAKFIANNPFINVTIWIAGMIAKSTKVALFGCVDKLAFGKGHKIKVL